MARIRTLKPEFWDSPSTAQADLAVRLTFMAMWNWADDSGHGTANVKELEAFVFPNDEVAELPRRSSRNSAALWPNFAAVLHEVAEVYGVVFYKVKGRPYYRIPSFNEHQAKHYRKESRYPQPEEGEIIDVTSGYAISSTGQTEAQDPVNVGSSRNSGTSSRDSGIGTGEQGNRGTGEQSLSSHVASDDDGKSNNPAEKYPDHVIELCDHLAEHIKANGNRVGKVGVHWWQAMDRLIRLDDYTPDQVRQVIDWSQQDEFWQGNILSAKKLREKFDQLKTRMFAERNKVTPPQQFQSAAERRAIQGMNLVQDELREFYQQHQEIEQ